MSMPLVRIIGMIGLLLVIVGLAQAGGYVGLFLCGCLGFIWLYVVSTSLWIQRGQIYAVRSIHHQRLQAGDRAEVTITIHLPMRYWLCWIVVEEQWTPPKATVLPKSHVMEESIVKREKHNKKQKQGGRESQNINSEQYACLAYIRGSRAMKCHYTTLAKARGLYRVHSSCVMIGDMFGLVNRVLIQDEQESEIVQVNAVPLAGNWIHQIQRESASTADYGTLRDYISGDPISSIDWKSYARYQTLKTKQLEAEERKSLLIVMDARKPYFELIVSAVTRLIMETNDLVQMMLVCGESRCLVHPHLSHATETGISTVVMDWLASIEATSLDSFTEQLSKAITYSSHSSHIYSNQLTMDANYSMIGLTVASNERMAIDNSRITYEHKIQIVYLPAEAKEGAVQVADRDGDRSYA